MNVPATRVSRPRGLSWPVLTGNVLSGALWLLALDAMDSWPLALIGAGYVLPASIYLAYFDRAWLLPWLGAAALWVWLLGSVMFENTVLHYVIGLVAGVSVGGLTFAAWQAVAAAFTGGLSRSRFVETG